MFSCVVVFCSVFLVLLSLWILIFVCSEVFWILFNNCALESWVFVLGFYLICRVAKFLCAVFM